jgi:hypothetical protein
MILTASFTIQRSSRRRHPENSPFDGGSRGTSPRRTRLSDEGYDLTDPKHSGYHDLMSDIWDNRDKTDRRFVSHNIDLSIDDCQAVYEAEAFLNAVQQNIEAEEGFDPETDRLTGFYKMLIEIRPHLQDILKTVMEDGWAPRESSEDPDPQPTSTQPSS